MILLRCNYAEFTPLAFHLRVRGVSFLMQHLYESIDEPFEIILEEPPSPPLAAVMVNPPLMEELLRRADLPPMEVGETNEVSWLLGLSIGDEWSSLFFEGQLRLDENRRVVGASISLSQRSSNLLTESSLMRELRKVRYVGPVSLLVHPKGIERIEFCFSEYIFPPLVEALGSVDLGLQILCNGRLRGAESIALLQQAQQAKKVGLCDLLPISLFDLQPEQGALAHLWPTESQQESLWISAAGKNLRQASRRVQRTVERLLQASK